MTEPDNEDERGAWLFVFALALVIVTALYFVARFYGLGH